MAQEALLAEISSLRSQAEQTVSDIEQARLSLLTQQQSLRQQVSQYGAKRIELLGQELQARGLTWCTRCSEVIAEDETELMFVEGKEYYSCGYENSCYGYRDFAGLHRACPSCREQAADKHGQRGPYDSLAKAQSSFYAFRVEEREDGYYARKFGNWMKLEPTSCEFSGPSFQLVERLTQEWGLPPKIEVVSEGFNREKLVIHE
jgi:hypothetical protein